jgi:signal transduction histidine kinase
MKKRGVSRADGSRSPLIVILLLFSLVVVAVLAEQAYDAERSHRAMAENVLRGYAALTAEEFTRRATAELGFLGYFQAITALREAATRSENAPLPAPADLVATANDETKRALALARTFYRFDPATGRLESSGAALSPDSQAWLVEDLSRRGGKPLAAGRRYDVSYALIGGALQAFVTLPAEGLASGRKVALGFAVDRDALGRVLHAPLARGPLLPPSLGGNVIGKDAIYLSLVDPFGGEIVRAGTPFVPDLSAEKKLGSEYGGILDRFVLRTAVDPAAAAKLAIGGLPRSRLPVLVALMAVTVGLTLIAALQLRRERLLGRMRSDFVSRVSHELRTPLTQIRMFAETLLLDRVRSAEERSHYLAIIDREARRLSNLVENVLRFSRTERGDVRLTPRPHDLGPLVRDLLEEFRPLAAGSGARLAAQVPDGVVVSVDDDALRQVLLNLLDNAVKYGPEGQEIRVGVTLESAGARVWVEDEGPGIPPGDRERIWKRFFRLDTHRESSVAGTGIGLTVVRDLVALHGGRSWVEPGERGGARFVVEFPTLEPAGAPS